MRLWPRSLFGRLLSIATLTTLVALAFAALAIGNVLERFVIHGLDQQLDAQANVLAHAIRSDGTLDPARAVSLPEFEDPGSGWGWRVDGPAGHWASGDAIVALVPGPPPPRRPDDFGGARDAPYPGEGHDGAGERMHLRRLSVASAAGPVLLTVAGPRAVATAPLREAMAPLLVSLVALGAALAIATLVQLRFGLAPLRRLRSELVEVRSGRLRHISTDQLAEIAPLAIELNALIDQNEQGLAHARRHVSNLAHGLKTPLAALGVRLAEPGRDPDGSLGGMVAQIDRRIRHHLGRARAAAPGSNGRARTPLAPAIADIVGALRRIHADRPVSAETDIAPGLAVALDPEDLDEIVGNLLDNAWRHTRSTIVVAARDLDGLIRLTIDDDGPGLTDQDIRDALVPGRRLDERGDGHGFGLPIAQELSELNGGSLSLGRSARGGLRALLTLPTQATRPPE